MSYRAQDTEGRIRRYPEEGRRYLRAHRRALAFFAENPRGTLFLADDFSNPVCSLREYQEATWQLLDRRINEAGGLNVLAPRDDEWALWRDKHAIEDLLVHRIRGARSFETQLAKKRFPEVERLLRGWD